jgi:hypothetical protein
MAVKNASRGSAIFAVLETVLVVDAGHDEAASWGSSGKAEGPEER